MEQSEWGQNVVSVIAGEVRRWRQVRKMSAQALADRCAEIGWPIKRSVLSNLESGYRETITVPELFVLSAALEVPPLILLVPLGQAEAVEVLPGVTTDVTRALRWITGENPLPGNKWHGAEDGDRTVARFQVHYQRVSVWETSRYYLRRIREGAMPGTEEDVQEYEQRAEFAAQALKDLRSDMRVDGLTPPPLPVALAFVDGEGSA